MYLFIVILHIIQEPQYYFTYLLLTQKGNHAFDIIMVAHFVPNNQDIFYTINHRYWHKSIKQ